MYSLECVLVLWFFPMTSQEWLSIQYLIFNILSSKSTSGDSNPFLIAISCFNKVMLKLINDDLKQHFLKKKKKACKSEVLISLGKKCKCDKLLPCVPADSDWTANVRTCSDIICKNHVHDGGTPYHSRFIILLKTWLVVPSLSSLLWDWGRYNLPRSQTHELSQWETLHEELMEVMSFCQVHLWSQEEKWPLAILCTWSSSTHLSPDSDESTDIQCFFLSAWFKKKMAQGCGVWSCLPKVDVTSMGQSPPFSYVAMKLQVWENQSSGLAYYTQGRGGTHTAE